MQHFWSSSLLCSLTFSVPPTLDSAAGSPIPFSLLSSFSCSLFGLITFFFLSKHVALIFWVAICFRACSPVRFSFPPICLYWGFWFYHFGWKSGIRRWKEYHCVLISERLSDHLHALKSFLFLLLLSFYSPFLLNLNFFFS